MQFSVIEAQYQKDFRKDEQEQLIQHFAHRYSVQLIGMRRIGISNFLRFFLAHQTMTQKPHENIRELFVVVDLKDLIEREVYPFWTLTFKRLLDAVEKEKYSNEITQNLQALFLRSIQSQDLFLMVDNIRTALQFLVAHDIMPTIFFLRFDRLQDAFTASFFDNIKGLRTVTNEKLTYVFTTYRGLEELFPSSKSSISSLGQAMYIKPAKKSDMKIAFDTYRKIHYDIKLPQAVENGLFDFVAGNMQYLQLALIILNEKKVVPTTQQELFDMLKNDERIVLESEELWESLTKDEKSVLVKIAKGQHILEKERRGTIYLWNTGFVKEEGKELKVFSPLLLEYVLKQKGEEEKVETVDLTRKEHLLFSLLQKNIGEICDREQIIEAVWPEYQEFGVSDWAIDRLVARVRVKLKKQKNPYEIITVRTRGYKLTSAKNGS